MHGGSWHRHDSRPVLAMAHVEIGTGTQAPSLIVWRKKYWYPICTAHLASGDQPCSPTVATCPDSRQESLLFPSLPLRHSFLCSGRSPLSYKPCVALLAIACAIRIRIPLARHLATSFPLNPLLAVLPVPFVAPIPPKYGCCPGQWYVATTVFNRPACARRRTRAMLTTRAL